jgi:hypothetical protein
MMALRDGMAELRWPPHGTFLPPDEVAQVMKFYQNHADRYFCLVIYQAENACNTKVIVAHVDKISKRACVRK